MSTYSRKPVWAVLWLSAAITLGLSQGSPLFGPGCSHLKVLESESQGPRPAQDQKERQILHARALRASPGLSGSSGTAVCLCEHGVHVGIFV